MSDTIRQLEQRVGLAVKRLSKLAAEKQQLEAELRLLKETLDGNGAGLEVEQGGDSDGWRSTRHELLQLIRQTLEESREPDSIADGV
ncbi:MAG: hypothetical protein OEV00_00910 [Acidobacteriota bacterium]|nr:hypothetical protein [Acidobacteriota bacterium]MDH3783865.1 hypothetical protein [Acidobacteriota bacterium]